MVNWPTAARIHTMYMYGQHSEEYLVSKADRLALNAYVG